MARKALVFGPIPPRLVLLVDAESTKHTKNAAWTLVWKMGSCHRCADDRYFEENEIAKLLQIVANLCSPGR